MAQPTHQQLLDENRHLRGRNTQLRQQLAHAEGRIERLESRFEQLTSQLQEALRATKRHAAPFSKGPPQANPRLPGRKAGANHGPKAHRPIPVAPPDERIDVPLPEVCPHCGGPMVQDRVDQQYQTEIPRHPILRRFDLHIGHCRRCGRRIQPRHPLQTSDALGAAASQLGPDAQAAIVHLNKPAGLSRGQSTDLFTPMFGLRVTPSGVCPAMLRAARRGEPIYQQILAWVPQAPWIVPDETGWRIGGRLAWMHGFVTPPATVYHVARGRGYEVAESILTERSAGTMIHDGRSPYDHFVLARHPQCLDHLRRRCKALLAVAAAGAARFPRPVRQLLLDALALRDRRDDGR